MARRRLMTDEAWGAVMALPSEERDLVRYCTLGADDLDRLRALRVAHNQLGHALLLCAMRHPGRALAPGERPPAAMVAWVARQLGVEATALDRWSNRAQTRREQIGDIMKAHGFTAFGREEAAAVTRWLTPTAQIERRPQRLIEILLAELRRRQILLPQPRVLELVVHRARAAAARVTRAARSRAISRPRRSRRSPPSSTPHRGRKTCPASPGFASFRRRRAHGACMP